MQQIKHNGKKLKVLETARKGKSFKLHNTQSTRSYILNMPANNFQSASPNIVTTSKTDQTTANLQNIFTKVTTNDNLTVTISQSNIKTVTARRYHEGKYICKLKTVAPHGLNNEIGEYAKELYNFY